MNSELSNDPDLAPAGARVMSCFVKVTPVELRGSDSNIERWSLAVHRKVVVRPVEAWAFSRVGAAKCAQRLIHALPTG